jgi:hypothetical protein
LGKVDIDGDENGSPSQSLSWNTTVKKNYEQSSFCSIDRFGEL